jgi:hypothetical protein
MQGTVNNSDVKSFISRILTGLLGKRQKGRFMCINIPQKWLNLERVESTPINRTITCNFLCNAPIN